ncbi:MAG: hypothetical protein ABR992_13170 [Solirubrobacteraceae bacterium]
MDLPASISRLSPDRGKLIDELAACITISEARWDGDEQTVVHVNRLLPSLQSPGEDPEVEDERGKARWQLRTAKPSSLYGFPAPPKALEEFHRAEAKKGRRLLVRDLDAGQIAAVLAWHFEEGPDEEAPRSRGKRLRPHLVTSMAVRQCRRPRRQRDHPHAR